MTNRTDMPLVSILTTTFNRARVVRRALESALAQDYDNLELVVVDNGSTDDTEAVVRSFCGRDERVHLHRYEQNAGSGGGRNRCLAHARGKYALYLDSDDELVGGSIRAMVHVAEGLDSRISFILSDCADGRTGELTATGPSKSGFVTFEDCVSGRYSGEHVHLFRREWVQAPGFEERAYGGEIIVWSRMLKLRPAYYHRFVARLYHKDGQDRITRTRRDQTSLRFQATGYEAYLAEFGDDVRRHAPRYYASLLLAWAKLELLAERRGKALELWRRSLQAHPQPYHLRLALQLGMPASLVWHLTSSLQQVRQWLAHESSAEAPNGP